MKAFAGTRRMRQWALVAKAALVLTVVAVAGAAQDEVLDVAGALAVHCDAVPMRPRAGTPPLDAARCGQDASPRELALAQVTDFVALDRLLHPDHALSGEVGALVLNANVPGADVLEHTETSWPAREAACLWVAVGLPEGERPTELALSLVAPEARASGRLQRCETVTLNADETRLGKPLSFAACAFSVTAPDAVVYSVSVRGAPGSSGIHLHCNWAYDAGEVLQDGGHFLRQDARKRIRMVGVPGADSTPTAAAALPSCDFRHERRLAALDAEGMDEAEVGWPRWRRDPWQDAKKDKAQRRLWYDDDLVWGNDVCSYEPVSMDAFSERMTAQGVRDVWVVGDSLGRYMWNDLDNMWNGRTQKWLKRHPYEQMPCNGTESGIGETPCSTWTGEMSEFSTLGPGTFQASRCNFLGDHKDTTECRKRRRATAAPRSSASQAFHAGDVRIIYQRYNAGANVSHIGKEGEDPSSLRERFEEMLRTGRTPTGGGAWDAEALGSFRKPDVVVFNTGAWLHLPPYSDPVKEAMKTAEAIAAACEAQGVRLVWRAASVHHVYLSWNAATREMNRGVARLLQPSDAPARAFVYESPYLISADRLDRTPDGLHFNYRIVRGGPRPKRVLSEYCVGDETREALPGERCIRPPGNWAPSAGRATTMVLLHLMMHTKLSHYV